jgi:hypothetical protein
MRAILIDSEKRTITEIEFEAALTSTEGRNQ